MASSNNSGIWESSSEVIASARETLETCDIPVLMNEEYGCHYNTTPDHIPHDVFWQVPHSNKSSDYGDYTRGLTNEWSPHRPSFAKVNENHERLDYFKAATQENHELFQQTPSSSRLMDHRYKNGNYSWTNYQFSPRVYSHDSITSDNQNATYSLSNDLREIGSPYQISCTSDARKISANDTSNATMQLGRENVLEKDDGMISDKDSTRSNQERGVEFSDEDSERDNFEKEDESCGEDSRCSEEEDGSSGGTSNQDDSEESDGDTGSSGKENDDPNNDGSESESHSQSFDQSPLATGKNKKLTRKRQRNEQDWVRNTSKKALNTGQAGTSQRGHPIEEKKIGIGCGRWCRFKCNQRVSYGNRKKLNAEYLSLGNRTAQWEHLLQSIEMKQNVESARRTVLCKYFLMINRQRTKVCQKMFMATYNISTTVIETIKRKSRNSESNQIIEKDRRGKHSNKGKKTAESVLQSIHRDINSYATKESHFCRSTTKRKYLPEGLNTSKMYRAYRKKMKDANKEDSEIASKSRYRYVFNHEYNLGFHRPKKDLCDECSMFNSLQDYQRQDPSFLQNHARHLRNKNYARKCVREDLDEAKKNSHVLCASFDLQKVLNMPHSQRGSYYYKRKVSVFNFTVCDGDSQEAHCFIWTEITAKRGGCEIASCLWIYIGKKSTEGKTEFRFASDNCAAQNRNQILFTMYAVAAKQFGVTIHHKYLVKGHTETSGDHVHSTIEVASRYCEISTEEEWCTVISEAKAEEPYHKIHRIKQDEILDFAEISVKSFWKDIKVSSISSLKIEPNGKFTYIYSYGNTVNETQLQWDSAKQLKKKYSGKIELSKEKKSDIQDCIDGTQIPTRYHDYYRDLINGEAL